MSYLKKLSIVFIVLIFISACGLNGSEENLDQNVVRGKNLFLQYCAACHDVLGEAVIVGPPLSHIATDAENRVTGMDAKTYIEQSLLYPDEVIVEGFDDLMPNTFLNLLAQEEIDSLMAYMLSLK